MSIAIRSQATVCNSSTMPTVKKMFFARMRRDPADGEFASATGTLPINLEIRFEIEKLEYLFIIVLFQFYKGYYNAQYRYNQATGDGFDRSTCQAIQVPGEAKQCCGSYTANLAYQQRQPISSNTHQCCADQRIKLCCKILVFQSVLSNFVV